ncbi:MAG TPA: hypothetical protein VHV83_21255 [Armatimonadota bacterium]|nr:hypothetical protein [Armatimonadota bacterium]
MRSHMNHAFLFVIVILAACLQIGWSQQPCEHFRLPANRVVENETLGEVTGDRKADAVFLLGERTFPDSEYARTHDLVVVDGQTGKQVVFPLGNNSGGYPGSLFLGDINGDKAADILIGLPTGGSGGITNYYLLTARDGTPRYLTAPQTLASGGNFTVTLQNNYVARVTNSELRKTYTLNLRRDPTIYKGVYSSTGRLLHPTSGTIDPIGFIEPVEIGQTGMYQLNGYQSIWVLFHANTIGYARPTWRWSGNQLRLIDVRVMQPSSPDEYARELSKLDVTRPAASVPRAILLYRQHFSTAPPIFREAAFNQFRIFHIRVQQSAEQRVLHGASEQTARVFNESQANRIAGLTAIYAGEGSWNIVSRPGFYQANFGPYLTPRYRDYLALEEIELNKPWARDAGLVITMTALGQRISRWEQYLAQNPDTPLKSAAMRYYQPELNAFLFGIENTPHFNPVTKQLRPGVADVMRTYIAVHPNAESTLWVAQVLKLYQRNDNILSPSLATALQQIRHALDPSLAANYFPLLVGSYWVYPFGSFENAGMRTQVQYHQENRYQVLLQNTATRSMLIYSLGKSAVTLIYRAAEANNSENRIGAPSNINDIIIQQPITAGHAWTSNGK